MNPPRASRYAAIPLTRIVGVVGLGLIVANCANNQGTKRYASREVGAFPESKYGKASPRVVADGEAVPKGGGRYLVGKSYSVAGRRYTPTENPRYSAVGTASWYGEAFHGRRTANGEVYDMASFTAAHPTMPLPSYARVTNLLNHRSMIVRVNDRGPFHAGRIMDVSERVAYYLDFKRFGTGQIKVDYVGPASTNGSDDRKLLATLRTDGDLAPSPVRNNPVMMASADLSSGGESQPSAVVAAAPVRQTVLASNDTPSEPPIFTPEPSPQQSTSVAFKQASGIPLPPDRPFEVGAGKGGFPSSVPAPVAAPQPQPQIAQLQPAPRAPEPVAIAAAPSAPPALGYAAAARPQPVPVPIGFSSGSSSLAALYYAEPIEAKSRFANRADPMARIKTANLVPMSAVPTPRGEFMVLAGVFRDAANAHRLATAMGKSATIKAIAGNGTTTYQVTAGPFASTGEAQAIREHAVRAGAADARVAPRQG